MATTEDAGAGWEIFREADFALSLEEINERLRRTGYSPVSGRTYRHYKKLQRYGYEFYIPINQLDVRTVRDPIWDKAVRGRYLARPFHVGVRLQLLVDDRLVEFEGDALQISDGEVVVRLRGDQTVTFFQGISATDRLARLIFIDDGEVLDVQIERIVLQSELAQATIRLTFVEVVDLERILHGRDAGSVTVAISVGSSGEQKFFATETQRLYWIFQGVESSRIVCQELLAELDPTNEFVLPVPRIIRLSSESPLHVVVLMAEGAAVVFVGIFAAYAKASKAYWESRVQKETALKLRWENELAGVRRDLPVKRVLEDAARTLSRRMRDFGVEPAKELPEDIERAENIVWRDIAPAAEQLVLSTEGQITIDPGDELRALNAIAEIMEGGKSRTDAKEGRKIEPSANEPKEQRELPFASQPSSPEDGSSLT